MPPDPGPRKGLNFGHPGGKEFLLAGGAAVLAALAWFWWKNRQTAAAGQSSPATGTSTGGPTSPTGLLTAWFQDHAGSSASVTVTVPNVTGLSAEAARAAVGAVGLIATGDGEAQDTVTAQSPPAGTAVRPGSAVDLTLRKEPAPISRTDRTRHVRGLEHQIYETHRRG
jgi:PASTA domain